MGQTITILIALFLVACSAGSAKQATASQNSSQATVDNLKSESRFEVKAIRNGAEIVNFSQVGAHPVGMIDEGELRLVLSSPDNKHHLTIELPTIKPGTYKFVEQEGGPKQGQARLDLQTEAAPLLLLATQGELKLDELDGKSCTGSFKASGIDLKGASFTIEGSFTKMLVKTV